MPCKLDFTGYSRHLKEKCQSEESKHVQFEGHCKWHREWGYNDTSQQVERKIYPPVFAHHHTTFRSLTKISSKVFWMNAFCQVTWTSTGILCSESREQFTLHRDAEIAAKVLKITRNFQASVSEQVGGKLCRTLDFQEQDWTPLQLYFQI